MEVDAHLSESDTRESAVAKVNALHSLWWKLFCQTPKTDESRAVAEKAQKELLNLKEAVLDRFGKKNPRYPACRECLSASLFGGPGHESSSMCRSGKKPHCTCDACF